jgi:hypothetical protein
MSIKDRIRRLEGRGSAACPECRNTRPAINAVYPEDQEPSPEYCPRCGRSLTIVIRVLYEDLEGEGA